MDDYMKACICEGKAEETIINKLLNNNKLIFSREELLEEKVIKCRSAKKFEKIYLGKRFDKKIIVYRILDSKVENFNISKAYKDKIEVVNVITSPEIEILVIINENKYDDYTNKYKSKTKASDYCKKILGFKNVKTKEFLDEYFNDVENLINCININKKHSKSSGYKNLADILK